MAHRGYMKCPERPCDVETSRIRSRPPTIHTKIDSMGARLVLVGMLKGLDGAFVNQGWEASAKEI